MYVKHVRDIPTQTCMTHKRPHSCERLKHVSKAKYNPWKTNPPSLLQSLNNRNVTMKTQRVGVTIVCFEVCHSYSQRCDYTPSVTSRPICPIHNRYKHFISHCERFRVQKTMKRWQKPSPNTKLISIIRRCNGFEQNQKETGCIDLRGIMNHRWVDWWRWLEGKCYLETTQQTVS